LGGWRRGTSTRTDGGRDEGAAGTNGGELADGLAELVGREVALEAGWRRHGGEEVAGFDGDAMVELDGVGAVTV